MLILSGVSLGCGFESHLVHIINFKLTIMNEIKYCVNHKGQKIKPYKSTYVSPKKQIDWNKIVNYACLTAIITVFVVSITILLIN